MVGYLSILAYLKGSYIFKKVKKSLGWKKVWYTVSPGSNGRLCDPESLLRDQSFAVAGSGLHLHTFDTQYYETPMISAVITWMADDMVWISAVYLKINLLSLSVAHRYIPSNKDQIDDDDVNYF